MSKKDIIIILFLTTISFPVFSFADSRPNEVKVITIKKGYELFLNNKPFYIQGAGVDQAFGEKGENYLKMAKELGANAVRTWGTDQGTKEYLDEAHRQGLYVDAGVWLNYVDAKKTVSYISDFDYMAKKEAEVLNYVKTYRDHPAILMWNLGNEVISFTPLEEERVAFCKYLEKLVQKVHVLDPNHPVLYACGGARELAYFEKYVPSLDIIGVNDYGSPLMVESRWKELDFGIPYLFTEFGAYGPWDLRKDANGRFIESGDYIKAAQYRNYWKLVRERRGKNIGGFVFHLGETTQETLTFFNINFHEYKKEPFIVMEELYRGIKKPKHAPRIKSFTGVPAVIGTGKPFKVNLNMEGPIGEWSYEYKVSTAIEGVLAHHVNSEVPVTGEAMGGRATLYAPTRPGLYRVYGMVKDQSGNLASINHTLKVE